MNKTGKKRNVILNAISIIIAVIMLFPVYWLIISSFKPNAEIFAKVPTFLPQQITFEAYVAQVAGGSTIGRAFLNSSIIALSGEFRRMP